MDKNTELMLKAVENGTTLDPAFFQGNGLQGIVMLCAGSVLAGLSILLFFGCRAATKGAVILTKNIAVWIKSLFMRRG